MAKSPFKRLLIAAASATIYSIVETAKENGRNPFEYLTYLFETLPNIDTKDIGVLDNLLPHSPELPNRMRTPIKAQDKKS